MLCLDIVRSLRRFIRDMDTSAGSRIFEFGQFELDAATRKLRGPDGVVEVPSRAFDVLVYMVVHRGELLDKTRLLKAVWPTTAVEEGNLSQCIFALRRALGDTATEPRFIATVSGRGYQFIAPVRESTRNETPEKARSRTRPLFYSGMALVLAVALLAAYRFRTTPTDAPASISVLPFADLSPGRDMEYFADGMAEELLGSLASVGGLRVTGRRSSFALKGSRDDAQSIGRKLHVDTILEGSVRKAGDRIRISAQLTRTSDGVSLWTETYDRKLDDVLDIQGSIAREVVTALAPLLRTSSAASAPGTPTVNLTQDADAYRAYLRGVYLFSRWIDRDPLPARTEFLRAVQRDPQFAKAWAMLARTHDRSATLQIGEVAQERSLASTALDKAMKLDPSIGDLWWVRLMFVRGTGAPLALVARDLEHAVDANPTDTEPMLWLAHTYLALARRDEALHLFRRAADMDPLLPAALWKDAWFSYALDGDRRHFTDRTDELERLLPHDPRANQLREWVAFNEGRALDWDRLAAKVIEADPTNQANHCSLAAEYDGAYVQDAAMYHARMCSRLDPSNTSGTLAIMGMQLHAGDIAAARATVAEAKTRTPEDPSIRLAEIALQYYSGDCPAMLSSIAQARPSLNRPEGVLDFFHDDGDVDLLVWCLRQQGNTQRVVELGRVHHRVNAPSVTAGMFLEGIARMAAASGDREALVANLRALVKTPRPSCPFVRHEPMIHPYLQDPEVAALLDTLEKRQAAWGRDLPKSSMRVAVPGFTTPARSP
jgi:TolB-like protein/DNA-binding winged helix-turn-helix (wHTH) protein